MTWTIEPLTADHECSGFKCGEKALDTFLCRHALRNQQLGYSNTYVAIRDGQASGIDGYYCVSMSSVMFDKLPDGLCFDHMPRYPMPAAHMGRLAISSDRQRQGLGGLLMIDAMRKMVAASEVIAARVVELVALNEHVAGWYTGFGFIPFKDAPLHLYLPIVTAREIILSAGR
ncbi:MAG TPA: hypothetical protein VFC78_11065 [Tepidisphaeraceae bacterium]|nr:hypothetical protein [Tepidisphaeraceae bacterium]